MVFRRKEDFIDQSPQEETANVITHGIGMVLSLMGFALLMVTSIGSGTVWHVVSCALYGGALVLLYTVSTMYHFVSHIETKKILRVLDHVSIYLLIAGTYMPLTLVVLRGPVGWTIFTIETVLCVMGILYKVFFGFRLPFLSAVFYLLMGWVAIIAMEPITEAITKDGVNWILLGGAFYTLGILFFAADKKYHYFHAIWHVFVLAGSICHFFMIFYYVLPLS